MERAKREAMSTDAAANQSGPKTSQETLFALPPGLPSAAAPPTAGVPRMQRPDRCQVVLRPASLDELLAEDHPARLVWEYVAGLDMTVLYQQIRAVEGVPGGTRSTRGYCWRCGCMRRWTGWDRRGSWTGCARPTWPISGSAVGCR